MAAVSLLHQVRSSSLTSMRYCAFRDVREKPVGCRWWIVSHIWVINIEKRKIFIVYVPLRHHLWVGNMMGKLYNTTPLSLLLWNRPYRLVSNATDTYRWSDYCRAAPQAVVRIALLPKMELALARNSEVSHILKFHILCSTPPAVSWHTRSDNTFTNRILVNNSHHVVVTLLYRAFFRFSSTCWWDRFLKLIMSRLFELVYCWTFC